MAPRERDVKENAPREKGGKENAPREKGGKEDAPRERGGKENAPKEKGAKAPKETAIDQLKRITLEKADLERMIQKSVQLIQEHYKKRAHALNDSLRFIERIYASRKNNITRRLEKLDWFNYFKCNGYPNNLTQDEVRDYIAGWMYSMKFTENFHDWQLDIDERSILTQDMDMPNKTRVKLQDVKMNVGDAYAERIQDVVNILNDLDENEEQGMLMGRIVVNVDQFRTMMREELIKYLDNFTKDVLYNAEGSMECFQKTALQYIFRSPPLVKKIWMLREIPLPKPRRTHSKIALASTTGKLYVPNVPRLRDCVVRELWTVYDHFSLLAPRYILQPESKNPFDFLTYIENEWQQIKDIENSVRSLLNTRMNDIEVALMYHIELDALKELRKNEYSQKKPKGPKAMPREKLTLGAIEDFDVYYLFEKSLEDEHHDKMEEFADFEFPLKPGEVNLRSHRIMGGVQQFMVYAKPYKTRWCIATSLRVANMEVPRDLIEQKLEVKEKIVIDTTQTAEPESFILNPNKGKKDAIYCIEMKLPKNIFWLSEPVPCRWEPWVESDEFDQLDEYQKDIFLKKNEGKGALFSAPVVDIHPKGPAKDFCLLDIPSIVDMMAVVKFFLEPNLPYNYENLITKGLSRHVSVEEVPKEPIVVLSETSRPVFLNYKPPDFNPAALEYHASFPDEAPYNSCPGDMFTEVYSKLVKEAVKESKEKFGIFTSPKKAGIRTTLLHDGGVAQELTAPQRITHANKLIQVDQQQQIDFVSADEEEKLPKHPNGTWTTKDITSFVYDSENGTVSFWTSRLGNFGLAQFCYSLLPFNNWILEWSPHEKNTVYFRLETIVNKINIKITPEGYYLEVIKSNEYLKKQKQRLNIYNLKRILQWVGLDIFPREDTALYVDGVSVKDRAMELHTYFTMAACCFTHIFKMSPLNRKMSCLVVILDVKDLHPLFELPPGADEFTPVVVKNLYCGPLNREQPEQPWDEYLGSQSFLSDTHFLQENNYRDLYSYVISTASFETIKILKKVNLNLQSNVADLLMNVRPLSFS